MNLVDRLTEPRDFEACRGLLEEYAAYPQKYSPACRKLGEMLDAGTLNGAVMEDRDRPLGQRIVQFGMTVFVTDDHMRYARTGASPHMGVDLISHIRDGRSPVLPLPEIGQANARDGLNLLVLHYGFPTHLWTAEEFPHIIARIPKCFFWLHGGYHIKEVLLEYYDRTFIPFALQGGFQTRAAPPAPLPYLLGVTREEALATPGGNIAQMFAHTPPRFRFRRGEQQVLQRALMGMTDEEVAAALGLGLATIKKRWIAAYDRVSTQMPDLLPEMSLGNTHLERKRGHEKRRHLLLYLSQHPEELRPVALPKSYTASPKEQTP